MSRIGPELPPHLLKKCEDESESDSSDEGYGPQLPSVACRGPALSALAGNGESSDSDDSYGPALPPQFKQNRNIELDGARPRSDLVDSDSDSDGEMIGPTIAEKTDKQLSKEEVAREFEMRSNKMKDKLEGKDVKEVKRESWMLELPEEKANSFGLGPRQFSRKGLPEKGKDRSMWTDSPAEKERKLREGVGDEEVVEAPIVNLRDLEMEKVSKELKQKRGADSLMELHEKKLIKKKKEDLANGEVAERRPFDRDIDLQANRFDDAVKKNMLKSAAKINDRFSQGNQKYL